MTTIKLRRRLAALEKNLSSGDPILLLMPDGRTKTLPGHNDYVVDLLGRALWGDRTPEIARLTRNPPQNVFTVHTGGRSRLFDIETSEPPSLR